MYAARKAFFRSKRQAVVVQSLWRRRLGRRQFEQVQGVKKTFFQCSRGSASDRLERNVRATGPRLVWLHRVKDGMERGWVRFCQTGWMTLRKLSCCRQLFRFQSPHPLPSPLLRLNRFNRFNRPNVISGRCGTRITRRRFRASRAG